MNFEAMQKAWQSQDPGAKVTINVNVLLNEVRHNQQHFRATIFWRDVREVGSAALMTVGFLVWGLRCHWWSFYLLAFACFEVGVFFVVDRRIQHRKQPVHNDSLQSCIEASLFQINHQIWLLRNVLWWYLLPPIIGIGAVLAQTLWTARGAGLAFLITIGAVFIITYGFTYGFVYWLNQRAVKKQLEPRRQELETLLAGLKEPRNQPLMDADGR